MFNKINEELQSVMNELLEDRAWYTLKGSCKDILSLDKAMKFYFGETLFDFTAEEVTDLQDKSGIILVLSGYYYDLYKDGKKVEGTLQGPEQLPDKIDTDRYTLFRLNTELRDFDEDDKDAMSIGVLSVMEPYGSRSDKCKEYLRNHGIDPEIKYVPERNVMASSYPYLKYVLGKGFVVRVGQYGKGFYDIPLEHFDRYCEPETDEDISNAIFIRDQD